ncbi:MAG: zinc ABC transporter substrate-binding protein [Alphaproteobacteria bacterium]|nr:zinc ABC transporter substrate-binding protein [Alphaproteobacteria bacterium]MBU0802279.1 zinc ABC transporter substrate-binding protein [Alphaproteobacteria bacterium]MBU0870279.1 zinc ABC transporter substrate-binding protein [Alphaproteobacteria bacterium]MBU1399778.1 zinc ABC transporter substrate-binding protein [Alphaproteobacteria bacterium]MBU1590164.1 zinc ABC transporter substrate-binding protein [Alphaproteobacteria bacterium]
MLRRIGLAATLIATTLGSLPAAAEPLKVIASFSIIGDFAENVGGDRIELRTLVGPDSDAHVYEPRPADAAAMAGADVVLVNGLHFEGFLQRLVEASATSATVVELTKGVEPREMGGDAHGDEEADGHGHGAIDPHAFQSIPNARIYVANIADAFCNADAEACATYRANAATYTARLDELDAKVRAAVAAIPVDKRTIITSHDAFGYFAHEYGLTFLAPEGISTEAEASAADVAALIEQVRHDKASAIFIENITNRRLVEQIASETGVRIGGTLYSDALSVPDGPAATYLELMENNIGAIRGAILGS